VNKLSRSDPLESPLVHRIVVVGTTGSGKSRLAVEIASILDCPVIELDELHWLPGWRIRPEPALLADVAVAVDSPAWVIAGNYSRTWPLTMARAELVVWIDYGFWRVLARLLSRSLRRIWTRERVCNGNVETLRNLVSRDSIVLWFFRTFATNRRRFAALAEEMRAVGGPRVARLRHPRDADALIAALREQARASA
jgi:adenylate kinase family enzyme